MQKLLAEWRNAFYTEPILLLVLIFTLAIAIKKNQTNKLLRPIPFYIGSLILVYLSGAVLNLTHQQNFHDDFFRGLTTWIDYSFTLVEMITFSIFFYQLITNPAVKRFIILSNIIFCLFFAYSFLYSPELYKRIFEKTQSTVYAVEATFLLTICICYFAELFKTLPFLHLNREPVFWVSTGLMFFLACTLSFSLLENLIRRILPAFIISSYSLLYIFYIVLSLMIVRAYLCKPAKAG